MDAEKSERVWVTLPLALIRAVDDYHHDNRFRSRSAAVRQLIEYGLEYAKGKRMT